MKESLSTIEVLVLFWFSWKVLKFLVRRKSHKHSKNTAYKYGGSKYKKNLIGKVWVLISMGLHRRIDGMILKKKENLAKNQNTKGKNSNSNNQQDTKKKNEVEFKVYRGSKVVR